MKMKVTKTTLMMLKKMLLMMIVVMMIVDMMPLIMMMMLTMMTVMMVMMMAAAVAVPLSLIPSCWNHGVNQTFSSLQHFVVHPVMSHSCGTSGQKRIV